MFIRFGFEIAVENAVKLPLILALSPHSSFCRRVLGADRIRTDPEVPMEEFLDPFENRRVRPEAPIGGLRIWSDNVV